MCSAVNNTMSIKFKTVAVVYITLILLNVDGQFEPKSSLTFVIDRTASMSTVITKVKKGSSDIFDAITQSKETPVDNYVMVSFADPDIDDAKITTEPEEFRSFIRSIKVGGGGDCPEMSLGGIKEGLKKSKPGSYLYVFTDALAQDNDTLKMVRKIATEKSCQVVFFLTLPREDHVCFVPMDSPGLLVYKELSDATSGQIFILNKYKLDKIIDYISLSVTSRRIIITAREYPEGQHNLTYVADNRTENVAVALSMVNGTNLKIFGPQGEPLVPIFIANLTNLLIFKVEAKNFGDYIITFTSSNNCTVVVSASSDVRFQHGFLMDYPLSFNDTHIKPISDKKNYLIIKLFGENVQLTSVRLLSPSYYTLKDFPLKLLDKKLQLYVTDHIYLPKEPFRISVLGTDNNSSIIRLGSMIIESEELLNPHVTIVGENELEYDDPLALRCNVRAYPRPMIEWIDKENGKQLEATILPVDPPYGYIGILKLANMTKDVKLQCKAYNKVETVVGDVNVTVNPYFVILERPKSIEVNFKENAQLQCKVNASAPTKIIWLMTSKKNVEISANGNTLTVKNVRRSRKFVCVVKNLKTDENTNLPATVKPIYVAPQINKTIKVVNVTEKADAVLTCSILKGIPKPSIRWYRKIPNSRVIELKTERNKSTITLRRRYTLDSATYICIANNGIFRERDKHYIQLIVETPPFIENDVEAIEVKENQHLYMTCKVQGVPKPEVVWLKNNVPLRSDIEIDRQYSFKTEARILDEGIYTCNATNKHGSAIKTVRVMVTSLRIVSEPQMYEPICGDDLHIQCVVEGNPKPNLKWLFFSFYNNKEKTLQVTTADLYLNNIQLNERGNYTCLASNTGGSKNITHEVDVNCQPTLQLGNKDVYYVKENEDLLRIYCNVTGNPKPTISWTNDHGTEVRTNLVDDRKKYYMEEGLLLIRNYNWYEDPNVYYCQAKNTIRHREYKPTLLAINVELENI